MQLSLDKYLSDVERHLRTLPPNIRAGEINEMASHLQQLRADFIAQGRTMDEAETLAMARFGSARKAGLRLRDVWEGNRGVWTVFFAALLSNYVLFIVNLLAGVRLMLNMSLLNPALSKPLAPVFGFWFFWTLLIMPFGLNFVLGRWGGRRVALSALPLYLALLSLPLAPSLGSIAYFSFNVSGSKITFPYIILWLSLMSFSGAWSGSVLKRRSRFAIVGGASLEEASARLRERQKSHLRRVLLRASTCALLLALIGGAAFAVFKARVDAVLHPPTPEAAVRVLLANPHPHFRDMQASTDVSTRLLPVTPQELQKNERRVSYTATMHATQNYRKRRIKYLQQEMKRALDRGNAEYARPYRDSIARLKPEGYTLSRTVRVRNTPEGWQIVPSRNANERPYAWLYGVYYER